MAGDRGIPAGRAYVELSVEDKLASGLRSAQHRLFEFGATLAAAGAGVIAPITAAVNQYMSFGEDIANAAVRTGVGVRSLSQLAYAAESTGLVLGDLESTFKRTQKTIFEAFQGDEAAAKSMERLNVSLGVLARLSPEAQFSMIADALNEVRDSTAKTGAATGVFGKSGTQILPMISNFRELQREARRLGYDMSENLVARAQQLDDEYDRLRAAIRSVAIAVGSELTPGLVSLGGYLRQHVGDIRDWTKANSEVLIYVTKVAGALTVLGMAQVAIAGTFKIIAPLIGFAGTGWKGLAAAGASLSVVLKAMSVYATTASASMAALASGAIASAGAIALVSASVAGMGALLAVGIKRIIDAQHYTAQLGEEMSIAREEGDKMREAQIAAIETLQELADAGQLTDSQMKSAKGAIALLAKTYGDLGVRVNESTRSIEANGAALDNAAKSVRNKARADLEAEKEQIQRNVSELEKTRSKVGEKSAFGTVMEWPITGWFGGGVSWDEAEVDSANRQLEEQHKKLREVRSRLKELDQAKNAAAFRAGEQPERFAEEEEASRAVQNHRMQMQREAHRAQIELMRDELAKALALIDARWDHELERAGRDSDTRAAIETSRELEKTRAILEHRASREREALDLTNRMAEIRARALGDEMQRELAMIDARYDAEMDAAQAAGNIQRIIMLRQMRDLESGQRVLDIKLREKREEFEYNRRLFEETQDLDRSISEARIRSKYRGIELEEKLLALQQRADIEDAERRGRGDDITERIKELYRLRREALTDGQGGFSVGSFSKVGLQLIGTGTGARLVKATEKSAQLLERIAAARNARIPAYYH